MPHPMRARRATASRIHFARFRSCATLAVCLAAYSSGALAQTAAQNPTNPGQSAPAKNPAPDTDNDHSPPAVNPGRPTVTDPASLTAPGWLETEFGIFQNMDRDRSFGTPLLLKLTNRNQHWQYRLENDGYIRLGDGTDGIGDTNAAAQYLFATQDRAGYDIAGRFNLKIPTARGALGTKKFDVSAFLLASRDFSHYADKSPSLHGDFNVVLGSLTRQNAPGTDTQFLLTASFTLPFKGGRWAYTNELVYASPILGQRATLTTMHGFTYAVHRYEVYDVAVQWGLQGDGAVFQILFGRTFYLGKLF